MTPSDEDNGVNFFTFMNKDGKLYSLAITNKQLWSNDPPLVLDSAVPPVAESLD